MIGQVEAAVFVIIINLLVLGVLDFGFRVVVALWSVVLL